MAGKIDADELPAAVRAQLRKTGQLPRRSPRRSMTADQVRTHALRIMAVIADLSPAERRRVLRKAAEVNAV